MPDNKAIVSRLLDAVWSKGQLSVIDELVSTDFVGYWPFNSEPVRGPREYKELVSEMRKVFPDQTIRILDQITEGDKVVTRLEVTGTQRGEFLTIPPTNKTLTVEGLALTRLANGRIVETRVQMDTFTMLRALGVVPSKIAMAATALAH